jgi:hypothetical protein
LCPEGKKCAGTLRTQPNYMFLQHGTFLCTLRTGNFDQSTVRTDSYGVFDVVGDNPQRRTTTGITAPDAFNGIAAKADQYRSLTPRPEGRGK